MPANEEQETSEGQTVPDFTEVGNSAKQRGNTGIPTTAYNRKVLTYSDRLGEIFEKLTGKSVAETFRATLLNEIGEANQSVKEFLVTNQNLTKEWAKPATKEEANKNIAGSNAVAEWLNTNHNVGLKIIPKIE